MKSWSRYLLTALLCSFAALTPARAQNQPVMTVRLSEVDVLSGTGKVVFVDLTNTGTFYTTPPTVTFSGGGGAGAAAVATINLSGNVSSIRITNPGAGYTSAPTVSFTAPTGAANAV